MEIEEEEGIEKREEVVDAAITRKCFGVLEGAEMGIRRGRDPGRDGAGLPFQDEALTSIDI
jgi:hypothetical protein